MTVAEKGHFRTVGQSVPRVDGEEKARGLTQYLDDLRIPGTWYGCVVRAQVSRGRLKKLTFDPRFDWSSVCVVTPEDIPGENVADFVGRDMPFIAHDWIQYKGEPLALIAAPTKDQAHEAAAHVTAEIEEHPALLTLRELVEKYKAGRAGLHTLVEQTISKGQVDDALAKSWKVVEGEYWAGHQEQLYIEPQSMVAIPEADGGVFIQGSLQCPYYVGPELVITLNLPLEKIRVKQAAVGGAFGGKEDFPTLIAGYCALLALKCKKPVKMVFDRHQDILYTTKRHPVWSRYRTGLNQDGSITSMKVDFVLDGGAYITLSPVVLYRGLLHSTLGYKFDHAFVDGHVYRTNTFPNGAFRGFGAPQGIWGLESHIDLCADACGMTPDKFRLKNALRLGDATATGQILSERMGTPDVLEKTLELSDFSTKLARCSRGDARQRKWYGIGLSFFGHGAGFTGDGEMRLAAKAALDLEFDAQHKPVVNVRISSTEMGQGTLTIMPQIAADGLGVDLRHVHMPLPDTKFVPDSGPTVASRTAMVVGGTVHAAARKLKKQLEEFASKNVFAGEPVDLLDNHFTGQFSGAKRPFEQVAETFLKSNGPTRVYDQFKLPPTIKWDQKTFRGDSYPSYSWGCNVVELEIDTLTMEVALKRIWSYWDIGRIINPMLAKGQIEGGLVQALGYALMEKMDIKDGLFDANRMQTYVVPTSLDVPEMDIHFIEYPYTGSELGAKGVGEVPMDGLAPAIANAIHAATGLRMASLPITPEKIFEAVRKARGK